MLTKEELILLLYWQRRGKSFLYIDKWDANYPFILTGERQINFYINKGKSNYFCILPGEGLIKAFMRLLENWLQCQCRHQNISVPWICLMKLRIMVSVTIQMIIYTTIRIIASITTRMRVNTTMRIILLMFINHKLNYNWNNS